MADPSPAIVTKGSEPADILRPGERAIITDIAKLQVAVTALEVANKDHRADFRWTWGGLVAGFILLFSGLIYGYNRLSDQLDQKITHLNATTIRTETKLEDLSQRLLPPPTPPRR